MHVSTSILLAITAFFTLIFASTTDAQWVNGASEACRSCLLAARNAQVPICKKISANLQSGHMSRNTRLCQCRAASSDAWITSCTKPEACDAKTAMILQRAYAGVKIGCIQAGISSI